VLDNLGVGRKVLDELCLRAVLDELCVGRVVWDELHLVRHLVRVVVAKLCTGGQGLGSVTVVRLLASVSHAWATLERMEAILSMTIDRNKAGLRIFLS